MFLQLLLFTLSSITYSYSNQFIPIVDIDPLIVGGIDADIKEYPYQVSLRARDINYEGHICGGSIISSKWVVTAAHCVFKGSEKNFVVVVGSSELQAGGARYNVSQVVWHERYDDNYSDNDVAVLKIEEDIMFTDKVQPIPLQSKAIGSGFKAIATGWGLKSYDPRIDANKLQKIELSTINITECRRREPEDLTVFDGNICTESPVGYGMCYGDSGGPLAVDGVLTGIVSMGIPCAHGIPDVFTSVFAYRSWIKNHTNV